MAKRTIENQIAYNKQTYHYYMTVSKKIEDKENGIITLQAVWNDATIQYDVFTLRNKHGKVLNRFSTKTFHPMTVAFDGKYVTTVPDKVMDRYEILKELKAIAKLISKNHIDAWQPDLSCTSTAVATQDFDNSPDDEPDSDIIKYNGWLDRLELLAKQL